MDRNLTGGLVEARQAVQEFAAGRARFEIVIQQDDPGDDLNEMELSLLDGNVIVSSYYSFRDEGLAVVLVRALVPVGFHLTVVEDFDNDAAGAYARTVAS